MPDFFITGKKGNGKSLIAVSRMRDYLNAGRPVATNIDLNLDQLIGIQSKKAICYRVPDKPTVDDLNAIGVGNSTYDEDKNGALVLDECAVWFNARGWNDKKRQPVIEWIVNARKLGWDVYFLVQDISMVDNQARVAFAEHVVYCKRTDRMKIPFVSFFTGLFGCRVMLPRCHVGTVKLGDQASAKADDHWIYRGADLFSAYDTKQRFMGDQESSTYQLLPPYLTHGRYATPTQRLDQFKKFVRTNSLQLASIAIFSIPLAFAYWPSDSSATPAFKSQVFSGTDIAVAEVTKKQELQNTLETRLIEKLETNKTELETKINGDIRIIGWMGSDKYLFKFSDGRTISTSQARLSGYEIASINRCRATFDGVLARCF